jgi:hypothetical protein
MMFVGDLFVALSSPLFISGIVTFLLAIWANYKFGHSHEQSVHRSQVPLSEHEKFLASKFRHKMGFIEVTKPNYGVVKVCHVVYVCISY